MSIPFGSPFVAGVGRLRATPGGRRQLSNNCLALNGYAVPRSIARSVSGGSAEARDSRGSEAEFFQKLFPGPQFHALVVRFIQKVDHVLGVGRPNRYQLTMFASPWSAFFR